MVSINRNIPTTTNYVPTATQQPAATASCIGTSNVPTATSANSTYSACAPQTVNPSETLTPNQKKVATLGLELKQLRVELSNVEKIMEPINESIEQQKFLIDELKREYAQNKIDEEEYNNRLDLYQSTIVMLEASLVPYDIEYSVIKARCIAIEAQITELIKTDKTILNGHESVENTDTVSVTAVVTSTAIAPTVTTGYVPYYPTES